MHQPSTRFTPNPSMSLPAMRSSGPTPLSAAALPSFDPDALDSQAARNRLEQIVDFLDNSLRLPDNARTFAMYLGVLMVIFAGAFMHVLMAAQIMQAHYALGQLEEEYASLERENGDIVFTIAADINLERLHTTATAQGYVPPQTREFVFVEAPVVAAQAATELATGRAPAPPALAQDQLTAGAAPLQSWGDFWARMWKPAPTTQSAPAPDTTSSLMSTTQREAGDMLNNWWQQTTTRAEAMFEQYLGR